MGGHGFYGGLEFCHPRTEGGLEFFHPWPGGGLHFFMPGQEEGLLRDGSLSMGGGARDVYFRGCHR